MPRLGYWPAGCGAGERGRGSGRLTGGPLIRKRARGEGTPWCPASSAGGKAEVWGPGRLVLYARAHAHAWGVIYSCQVDLRKG